MKKKNNLDKIVFLIPSLDPDERMCPYIDQLVEAGAKHIILVDDGSHKENKKYFKKAAKHKEVVVLTHAINQGKGRGLKTGINYVINNMIDVEGIVTADSDGQHSCEDTIGVANKLLETGAIILGTRNFNDPSVPFKSRNGNKITTKVFKLLYGKEVNDTQTGLRGLPSNFFEACLSLPGERFEYEIKMLIKMVKDGRPIIEYPIETIYDSKENHQTHFNPIKDSIKIYRVMFGSFFMYIGASLTCTVIDLVLFTILTAIPMASATASIFIATAGARAVSSFINYLLNKTAVFKSTLNVKETIFKYYTVVICRILLSSTLVSLLFYLLGFNKTLIKVFVDMILFIVTFKIQNRWVFKEEPSEDIKA